MISSSGDARRRRRIIDIGVLCSRILFEHSSIDTPAWNKNKKEKERQPNTHFYHPYTFFLTTSTTNPSSNVISSCLPRMRGGREAVRAGAATADDAEDDHSYASSSSFEHSFVLDLNDCQTTYQHEQEQDPVSSPKSTFPVGRSLPDRTSSPRMPLRRSPDDQKYEYEYEYTAPMVVDRQSPEVDYGYGDASQSAPDSDRRDSTRNDLLLDYGYGGAPDRSQTQLNQERYHRRSSCGILEDSPSSIDMPVRKPRRCTMRRCSVGDETFQERLTIQRTMSNLGGFSATDAERKAHQRRRGSKLASLSSTSNHDVSIEKDLLTSPRGQRQRRRGSLGMVDCEIDDVTLIACPNMTESDVLCSPRAKYHQHRRISLGHDVSLVGDNRVLPATEELSTSVHLKRMPPPRRSSMGAPLSRLRSPSRRRGSVESISNSNNGEEPPRPARRRTMDMFETNIDGDFFAQAKEELLSRGFQSQNDNPPDHPQRQSAIAA